MAIMGVLERTSRGGSSAKTFVMVFRALSQQHENGAPQSGMVRTPCFTQGSLKCLRGTPPTSMGSHNALPHGFLAGPPLL